MAFVGYVCQKCGFHWYDAEETCQRCVAREANARLRQQLDLQSDTCITMRVSNLSIKEAISQLVADIQSFLIPDNVGGGLRATQVLQRCSEFLHKLHHNQLNNVTDTDLVLSELLYLWLKYPDDCTPLEAWVRSYAGQKHYRTE